MPEMNGFVGLCSTCNNAPTCYHRARRGPALFCETFDDYVSPFLRSDGRKSPLCAAAPMAPREAQEQAGESAGLCANCRHRPTCAHSRPAGGVWHCEDYE